MTMCTKCGGNADAFLCWKCGTELRHNLTQMCWLSDELGNAATKQTALTVYTTKEPNPEESPVPFNGAAHQRFDELRTVAMRWVRDFCDQEGWEFMPVDAVPADFIGPLPKLGEYHAGRYVPDRRDRWRMRPDYTPTTRDLARWLRRHYLAIVNSEDALLCAIEIENAVAAATREINPRRRVFCGPCPKVTSKLDERGQPLHCNAAIWANWDFEKDKPEEFATCRRCRTEHQVQKLLDAGFEAAQDYLMTRSEILDVLAAYGTPLSNNTFKQWRHRRKFRARGWKHGDRITDIRIYHNDNAVYRLGDVRELCRRAAERQEAINA